MERKYRFQGFMNSDYKSWYDYCFLVVSNCFFTNLEKAGGVLIMSKRKYTMKTACPQCGCSFVQVLSPEEIREKYGDVPNVELECGECTAKYLTDMEIACPEWDKECKMQK